MVRIISWRKSQNVLFKITILIAKDIQDISSSTMADEIPMAGNTVNSIRTNTRDELIPSESKYIP